MMRDPYFGVFSTLGARKPHVGLESLNDDRVGCRQTSRSLKPKVAITIAYDLERRMLLAATAGEMVVHEPVPPTGFAFRV